MSDLDAQSDQSAAEGAGHGSTRQSLVIFGLLAVLTLLEVAVVRPEVGIERGPAVFTLIVLALAKAALVALFFMHLKSERKALRQMVFLPFLIPVLAAAVLVLEAAWRHR